MMVAVLPLLFAMACGGGGFDEDDGSGGEASGGGSGEITVGGANFTEGLIMQEMYAALLDDAGFDVTVTTVAERETYAPSLETGEIDVVPEYAATLADFLQLEVNGPDAPTVASSNLEETMSALRDLAEKQGLAPLEPTEAVDTNAFAVTESYADENDLETLTDLGKLVDEPIVFASTPECPRRPYCEPGLEKVYDIEIEEIIALGFSTPQTKEAVESGEATLGLVGSTDGTLGQYGLVTLEDDKSLQNTDNVVPVVNADTLADHPEIADALNALAPVLTTEDLIELNRQVDVLRMKPASVATTYLEEQGLVE